MNQILLGALVVVGTLGLIFLWVSLSFDAQEKEAIKAKRNGCICDLTGTFVWNINSRCPYHYPKSEQWKQAGYTLKDSK